MKCFRLILFLCFVTGVYAQGTPYDCFNVYKESPITNIMLAPSVVTGTTRPTGPLRHLMLWRLEPLAIINPIGRSSICQISGGLWSLPKMF